MEPIENKKMDGLCELTAKTQFWPGLGNNLIIFRIMIVSLI